MITSSLLALALAIPHADAANVPKIKNIRIREVTDTNGQSSLVATTSGSDTTVASIKAELESDAGSEEVTLVESDAWLHGAATISALPKTDATVTLYVYDTSSTLMATFSGTCAASVSNGGYHQACTRMKRADFCATGDRTTCTGDDLDLDVLASATFSATKGYDVAFDLAGADTYDVAYATLVLTEGKTDTKATVDWDDVGAIWEGELSEAPIGQVTVKATTYDSKKKKLDSAKVEVSEPWADGGAGLPALPTDDDPLTSLTVREVKELADILKADYGIEPAALTVVSQGWNTGDTLPVDASVELTGGKTLTVPVNSVQRAGTGALSAKFGEVIDAWFTKGGGDLTVLLEAGDKSLVIDSSGSISGSDYVTERSLSFGAVGSGAGVLVTGGAYGDWDVSTTVFATTEAGLSTSLPVTVTLLDEKGNTVYAEKVTPTFEDELAVVFCYAVSFSEDPIGLDLSGKVSLLGEANKKGKQETLSKGKFYGSVTRNDDGALGLAGADKDAVSPRGDILIGGEPIGFELTDSNKDGVITTPPVVVMMVAGPPTRSKVLNVSGGTDVNP